MKLDNKYTSDLTSKDRNLALNAAKHIIDEADIEAWECLVQNSDYIFPFIKQNIAQAFSDVVDDNNYQNLFELFKIHSSDWDECLIQILLRFSYSDSDLTARILDILDKGTEDEKAYAARYFSFITDNRASYFLFEAYKSSYEPLKYNAASALGNIGDVYSYEYYLSKLESDDDWEKSDAAQFLNWYGNKKALPKILESMSKSAMSEYLAGEAAILDNISKYFNSDDISLRDLSLECYENIITSLVEIWPLSAILDFKIHDCVHALISNIKNPPDQNIISRYATLVLKTRYLIQMFIENEQYRFNEPKEIIEELEAINSIMRAEGEDFWQLYESQLIPEIQQENEKRKVFAISLIQDLKITEMSETLKYVLRNKASEKVIYQAVLALNEVGDFYGLDKSFVLGQISDNNIKALIESIWLYQ